MSKVSLVDPCRTQDLFLSLILNNKITEDKTMWQKCHASVNLSNVKHNIIRSNVNFSKCLIVKMYNRGPLGIRGGLPPPPPPNSTFWDPRTHFWSPAINCRTVITTCRALDNFSFSLDAQDYQEFLKFIKWIWAQFTLDGQILAVSFYFKYTINLFSHLEAIKLHILLFLRNVTDRDTKHVEKHLPVFRFM